MCVTIEQLNEWAIAAQQCEPSERQTLLTQLMAGIVSCGRLCRPYQSQLSKQYYEDIYAEAVQDLLLYLCQHIDRYNPDQATVIGWANMLLERRFFRDARAKVSGKLELQRIPPEMLEQIPKMEDEPGLVEVLRTAIEADVTNEFKQTHVREMPHVNFQCVALKRLDGQSWDEIAAEFKVKPGTVSSFYSRSIKRLADVLRRDCNE